MDQPEVNIEDFLSDLGFGEVRVKVVSGKLFLVPKQTIERPMRFGVRIKIVIREPIRLKCA